jgi:hypothetical protein
MFEETPVISCKCVCQKLRIPNTTIQSEKMMLIIVWNPTGFHVIKVLGAGCKFNTILYITEVLSPLAEWHSNQVAASDRKLVAQADNARPHTARISLTFLDENHVTKSPHTPYLPRLTPSYSFLFGHVK